MSINIFIEMVRVSKTLKFPTSREKIKMSIRFL